MRYQKMIFGSVALALSAGAMGHGLVSDPPSRMWTCGAETPPDRAEPGSACAEAFEDDFQGGYQFMSVLTHSLGRSDVRPLPDNVCGFDSSTWDGGATPWDKPIDWPTNPMSAGEHTFTWAIEWGPHFDDTEDFKYWITKPDFQYQVGVPLTWDDFEEEPFCELGWDDNDHSAHPNVEADYGNALFHTTCNVPERSGRHVIYAEWGRNYFTYERFHGCIDVQYSGGGGSPTPPALVADISASPSDSVFAGAGEITLSAANSQGNNLSYSWGVDASNSSLYSLSSTSGETTTLSLAEPQAESSVTVRLQVSDGDSTNSTSFAFTHMPLAGASWEELGVLTNEAQTLEAGDTVQLRLVGTDGSDSYVPQEPLEIDSSNAAASSWTYALAQAVNNSGTDVRVGVVNSDGDVEPVQSATDNYVYAQSPSAYASAFLQVESGDSGPGDDPTTPGPGTGGDQCNWYGTTYPLCENDSGWGWENNQSCIGAETCSGQPDPYGIVGDSSPEPGNGNGGDDSEPGNGDSEPGNGSGEPSAPGGGNCEYVIADSWGDGFTASIVISNDGSSAINGWTVEWDYSDSTEVTNSWNADVSGSGPYTASDMGWNGTIQPGESVEFGFQGTGSAETPAVTGAVCD